ncbi:MAG TPA: peptidoglycan editing factor PgeF [Anaerolineales bacterium]|nr:peptidoglycan editing factor PgeF [Anaerolineales bacterium]
MPFVESSGLRYYQFDIFPPGLSQAVFTRRGGVSPQPWDTLNVGGTVGDDAERVGENRMRSFAALGRSLDSMFDVWQVHSADVVVAAAPRPPGDTHHKADVILTREPGVTLYMRFADCVPVMLYDPLHAAIGLAHAGWLGTVRGASRAAVAAMQAEFGSRPGDILAAIGPSIGPDHYEVGADVLEQVAGAFGKDAAGLIETRNERSYLDLWAANRLQLQNAGVKQIEISGVCTACHTDDWFSHRAEKGRTGRFGALLALPG